MAAEAIPFPAANSIISSICGAISGRRAAAPPRNAPRTCPSLPRPSGETRREWSGRRSCPHLGAPRPPRPCHSRARIQSFQAFAASFPGDWLKPCRDMRAARVLRPSGETRRECSREGSCAPGTRSCGSMAAEAIPIPGADPIFSSRCGAISGRAGFSVRPFRAAAPATETPRPKGRTTGSCRPAFARRAKRRASTHRLQAAAAGTASTEPGTRPPRSGRRQGNKHRTLLQPCQEIVGLFGGVNRICPSGDR